MAPAVFSAIGKKITVIVMAVVFLFCAVVYVISDAILQRNSLKVTDTGAHKEGNFSTLVNWLPQSAKTAIEYRAKSVFLQNRMIHTQDPDERARAAHEFADYIQKRDPKGADSIWVDLVTNPETKNLRWAYPAYARLLLDSSSRHPVSLKELHAYIAQLKWPEDRFAAWERVQRRTWDLRLKPMVRMEVMAPIWNESSNIRNFDRFFNDMARDAHNAHEPEIESRAKKQAEALRSAPYFTNNLLKAPIGFRRSYEEYRAELAKAKTTDEKIQRMTALAMLTRDFDNRESDELFARLMTEPAFQTSPYRFVPRARLLLYRWNKKYQQSIKQYHEEIARVKDPMLVWEAWTEGMMQLIQLKVKPQVMYEYLAPLLDRDIRYQEYAELFRELSKSAKAIGKKEAAAKADDFLLRVQETVMPSLGEVSETKEK